MTCTSFLSADFTGVHQQIAKARALVLFLDFDGTLAPIRDYAD